MVKLNDRVMDDKKPVPVQTIIVVIVILLVLGVGYWYWSKKQASEEAPSLGSEIFDKTQNPLGGKLPDTNPIKDQKNPFDTIYKNPFK